MYRSFKINAALPTHGTRTRHVLPVYGTKLQIPYTLITGAREGLTAVITAGIHSTEYVGVQAAIEIARELDPQKISGTVIVLPIVNRSGFETRGTSLVPEDGILLYQTNSLNLIKNEPMVSYGILHEPT